MQCMGDKIKEKKKKHQLVIALCSISPEIMQKISWKSKKINDFKNSMLNQTRNLFRSILMRQREQIIRKKVALSWALTTNKVTSLTHSSLHNFNSSKNINTHNAINKSNQIKEILYDKNILKSHTSKCCLRRVMKMKITWKSELRFGQNKQNKTN